jgi:hypothetical protein
MQLPNQRRCRCNGGAALLDIISKANGDAGSFRLGESVTAIIEHYESA